jgi:hypothetical protein
VPDFELPNPTIGAPPPEKLVADWLPMPPPRPPPLLLDPPPEATVEVPPGPGEVDEPLRPPVGDDDPGELLDPLDRENEPP